MKQIDAERGTVTFSVIQGYRMRNRLKQYGFRVPAGKKCLHGSSEKMRRADQADCGRSPRIGVQGFWTDWSAGLSRVKFQATSQPQVQRDTERWLIHSNLHHYRNREGEYQVIDIHGDEMTIRYTSGKTIRTDISTQQRILDNLEIEDDIAEDERLRSQHDKHVLRDGGRTGGHNPKFDGFSAADFGSLEGSSWRGRDALGGVLRDHLRTQTGVSFQSWAVRRRLELHLARPDKYDFDAPLPCAKLFVYTHDDLAFGYYIETPSRQGGGQDSMDRYRHWENCNRLTNQSTMQSAA
ncbi:MAG: hypothetical protein R2851_03975 [Caldilineaceae bacterium]